MKHPSTKILIFTEGTVLMPAAGQGMSREERVQQSAAQSDDVKDFAHYVPVDQAVQKLRSWKKQGAVIYYLTSRTSPPDVLVIRNVLVKYHFPDSDNLLSRQAEQTYSAVAEAIMPTILIEDDCESIGGEKEMTYPHIKPDLKSQIHAVVIKEFAGIDHLPDAIADLLSC